MSTITAWAPSHATLFFAVPPQPKDYLKKGSLGGGINFQKGITTSITLSKKNIITYNKKLISGNTTLSVIDFFCSYTKTTNYFKVEHSSEIPTGYGLSTSGAGAIGIALTLNELLDVGFSYIRCLQIAHTAEILSQTGLGSVLGLSAKGIEVRQTLGAPGIGKVLSKFDDSTVLIIPLNPLSTKKILNSKTKIKKITTYGFEALNSIRNKYDIRSMLKVGKRFMFKCGLATTQILEIIENLKDIDEENCSMAMLGETIILHPNHKQNVAVWLKKKSIPFIVSKVAKEGPKVCLD